MTAYTPDIKQDATILKNRRILVVEDRGLIARKVAQILDGAGCVLLGPYPILTAALDAMRLAAENGPDAAALDIDLRGEPVYPLAEVLRASGTPFLFLTGYGGPAIAQAWQMIPVVEKPFDASTLLNGMKKIVANQSIQSSFANGPVTQPASSIRSSWEKIRSSRDCIMEGRVRFDRAQGHS